MLVNIPETLRQYPAIDNLGIIPNPEQFSAHCPEIYGKGNFDVEISTSGGSYDFTLFPEQFHGAAYMAIEKHWQTRTDQPGCIIRLSQGLLHPNTTFRVNGFHIDAITESYPDNPYPKNDIFAVSDALCTVFQDQTFVLPREGIILTDDLETFLRENFKTQSSNIARVVPQPHHMMRYDSYVVHAAQLPATPTERTWMMIQFY